MKTSLKTQKLVDSLAMCSTCRGTIIKSMGHSVQNLKMDTVMFDSNHWLGWSQSVPSFISISPEIPIHFIWGDVLKHSPFAAPGFLFCLITTVSCMATSGDPGCPEADWIGCQLEIYSN